VDKSKNILKRLELLHPKKIDLSLNRLQLLLEKLGNPHLKLAPVIHVAGTNGKGSVTSYLRTIYEKNGLKVHTYTSPHLIRFNERIRINSHLIKSDYLSSLLEECEEKNNGKPITFFEITTAAAFLAFSRNESDLILLETGLGGRFDATNIINESMCSVITPISMDHMNFLGSNLLKIAGEKIGIVKKNSHLVVAKQKPSVRKLIRKKIFNKNVALIEEGNNWKVLKKFKTSFIIKFFNQTFEFPNPNLYGNHQIDNAATAIVTALTLKKFKIDEGLISKAITQVNWPGRMQKLNKGKLQEITSKNFEIWLDGGHNVHAAEIISNEIKNWSDSKIILILGMIEGKDPKKFLQKIIDKVSLLILLPIDDHQYIHPYKIMENINKNLSCNMNVETCVNILEAMKLIVKKFSSGRILICGSLYLAGQVLKDDGFKIK
jgi:dihydrofolate synthase/folylpolyglutamate synthase